MRTKTHTPPHPLAKRVTDMELTIYESHEGRQEGSAHNEDELTPATLAHKQRM